MYVENKAETLLARLRIKAGMIRLGEAIALHSECDLMDEAAQMIDKQRAAIERLLRCPALCMDDLELEDVAAIEQAYAVYGRAQP